MSYVDKEKVCSMFNRFFDDLKGNEAQVLVCDMKQAFLELPNADVVDSAWAKALEKDVEIIENKIIKIEAQRDALLEELQRLADCSTCKFNIPDAVDGCSALMPCKDGHLWEWKGVKQ